MGNGFSRAGLDMLLKPVDIRARTEGAPGTSNHNNPDAGVELDLVELYHHGSEEIVTERVQLVGTVQG
jgi:hypothetical protein